MNSLCPICKEPFGEENPTVVLRDKGSQGINRASQERGDSIQVKPGELVHQQCRHVYTNKIQISMHLKKVNQSCQPDHTHRNLRSAEPQFNFKEHCLFCGKTAKFNLKKRGHDAIPVRTVGKFENTILQLCENRQDQWSETVRTRILSIHDLHAADALYHQECSSNFRTGKQVPLSFVSDRDSAVSSKRRCGRPQDRERNEAFIKVIDYLEENDEEQITIIHLIEIMKGHLADTDFEAYSFPHMKKKLKEHFGENIIITDINGKPNVVTLFSTASATLQQFYHHQKDEDAEREKLRLVAAAAKIIKNDIKSIRTSPEFYPEITAMSSAEEGVGLIPESLVTFLNGVLTGKNTAVKLASLGQALMQAARPRVLTLPLQMGLGIQMHHHFGSRFLIDTLSKMGFSCSYDEVKKFNCSAASINRLEIPGFSQDHFIQYAADNVDHNVRTLDGLNTFHGMGMIAAITPGIKQKKSVPKIQVSSDDISAIGRIKIHFYHTKHPSMSHIQYKEVPCIHVKDETSNLDTLINASLILKSTRPSWSGVMQAVHNHPHPGKASTIFLPMIDMDPSDMSCIYSTLQFLCCQANKLDVTPIITFDQPLWWKANMIIQNEPVNSNIRGTVLRLGGLHTEMSFLGCIGHLMAGSGLREVLEVIYAENAVGHILSGKAVSRAIRGHMIVDSVLNVLLISLSLGISNLRLMEHHASHEDNITKVTELEELADLYDRLVNNKASPEQICEDECLQKMKDKLACERKSMEECQTARLWFLYMDMVTILKKFIKAERIGHWRLHVQAMNEMLPYLAASGHNLYAKSIKLYLQQMAALEETHPDVYQRFEAGFHVVRRSDRFWGGLSTDLIIEQVLMRSLKTTGGLTRGRGMDEKQRLVWLLSMPTCVEVNSAMQDFTEVKYHTSEQHKEMGKSRQLRDTNDTGKIMAYLESRNPFVHGDISLHSISNGVTAGREVNVLKAKEIGQSILDSMNGMNVDEFVFRKKKQAVTLDVPSSVKIDQDIIQVDPHLLFQRLLAIAKVSDTDLKEVFVYEMCSIPPALFDVSGLLRPANKPVLADSIRKLISGDMHGPEGETHFVLDGGALLQRIPWTKGLTYGSICHGYVEYIQNNYGNHATVVFDGYSDEPSTKDQAHLRRTKGIQGVQVNFTEEMPLNCKKEIFLSNKSNKQKFLDLLSKKLKENGWDTFHSEGDADLLICKVAIRSSLDVPTILIGDDTDLLVLLCHHGNTSVKGLYLQTTGKNTSKQNKIWNIKHVKSVLGEEICRNLLFMHAFLGCDSTSSIYGIGKGVVVKKMKLPYFQKQAEMFSQQSSHDDIAKAGEAAFMCLYGETGGSLDELRYRKFCTKVASSSMHVEPKSLPPTSAAAKFHSFRVYFQVQQWMEVTTMNPCHWGWQEKDGQLFPIKTDQQPAPQSLLKVIRCSCKSDCKTKKCTCRKYGLDCTDVCGECRGISCTNTTDVDFGD